MSLLGLLCGLGSVFPPSRWVTSGPLCPRPGATTSATPCCAQDPLLTLAGLRLDLWPLRWTLHPSGGLGAFVRPAQALEVALGI